MEFYLATNLKENVLNRKNVLYEITQIQKNTPTMFPHNLEASFYFYMYLYD